MCRQIKSTDPAIRTGWGASYFNRIAKREIERSVVQSAANVGELKVRKSRRACLELEMRVVNI